MKYGSKLTNGLIRVLVFLLGVVVIITGLFLLGLVTSNFAILTSQLAGIISIICFLIIIWTDIL